MPIKEASNFELFENLNRKNITKKPLNNDLF